MSKKDTLDLDCNIGLNLVFIHRKIREIAFYTEGVKLKKNLHFLVREFVKNNLTH
jgi:hypothetical protein